MNYPSNPEVMPPPQEQGLALVDKLDRALSVSERMAKVFCESGLYGLTKPAQAQSLILLCLIEGTSPSAVLAEHHFIQGRKCLRADAMLSRFGKAGGTWDWIDTGATGQQAEIKLTINGKSMSSRWTIEQARKAGLVKADSNWVKYPDAMLRARAVSAGVRMLAPQIVCGEYTPEEVEDFVSDARPADAQPAEISSDAPAPLTFAAKLSVQQQTTEGNQ
jgi:hypothetical protein